MASTMNPKIHIDFEPENSKIKAYCSATLYGSIAVKGIKVIEGQKGLFIQMPQQKRSNGEYQELVFPITKEAHAELYDAVLDKYQQRLTQTQTQAVAPQGMQMQ